MSTTSKISRYATSGLHFLPCYGVDFAASLAED